jgi:hypothetical protein
MAEDNRDIAKLLLIPAGTVLSYGVAYAFQSGHAKFFSVPHEFVDITLASGLTAAIGSFLFFLNTLYCINLPVLIGMELVASKSFFWKQMMIVQLSIVFAVIVVFLALGVSWSLFLAVVFIVLGLESVLFVFPIMEERFIRRTGKPLVIQIEEGSDRPASNDVFGFIIDGVGFRQFQLFVMYPLLLLGIGYLGGYYIARNQNIFYRLEETDFVCIGRYGTHFVFRKYNTTQHLFQNEFMAVESSDMSSRRLMKTLIKNAQFENK